MSTVTSSNITHLAHNPHAAHPVPLREQAFTLHCQGLRSPAISQELGVPERTIRSWIASALAELKDDLQLNRKEQLLLAVERHNMITATAWQQFHHEAATRDAILEAALDTLLNANNPNTSPNTSSARPFHLHLPASTPAPRYLSLVIQANKEINRLLGLHTLARLHLLNPDVPDTDPSPFANSDIPAESATAFTELDTPANSATVSQSAQADFAAARHPGAVSTAGISPAESATTPVALDIPAESATDPTTPCSFVSSVSSVSSVLNPRPPAASATAPSGLAAGLQPAHPHPTIPSPTIATDALAAPLSAHGEGPGVRFPAPLPAHAGYNER